MKKNIEKLEKELKDIKRQQKEHEDQFDDIYQKKFGLIAERFTAVFEKLKVLSRSRKPPTGKSPFCSCLQLKLDVSDKMV